jgi:hypothetical protein
MEQERQHKPTMAARRDDELHGGCDCKFISAEASACR